MSKSPSFARSTPAGSHSSIESGSYNLMEPANEEQLADPQAHFVGRGGQIFVALHDGNVIGTCAVTPHGVEGWELAKLAVSAEFRGHGIARRLVERLQAALRLYESLGFRYRPVPEVKEYQNEDVYMELRFDIPEPAA